ncbi:hypothetical protein TIFTF001_007788 [Ficus carica]|uniref:Uncharacterized protein n=1 Tax=Ficus carica TaxID=3494 RepID=A0AA87ZLY2_FICCA|nr:hypothetical protein TIFTF001_007788 [Ficus carica]
MLGLIDLTRSLCGGSLAKGEAPRSDGETGGVSVTGTPMLKSVRPQLEQAAEVDDGICTVAGYASYVRWRIECCDRVPPPVMHVQGVDCPGQQHRPRIQPNPGTWQILMM